MTRILALILAAFTPTHSHTTNLVEPKHERATGIRHKRKRRKRVWYSAVASIYDQWSGNVACGFRAPNNMGVANKTLPCGTWILFRYHGQEASAEVIDRGPYISGRTWDLSEEVQRALGFPMGVDSLDYSFQR